MIYWFTGKSGVGKTVQSTKLKEFLQTEKRNWRKDVFHIDGDDNFTIDDAQTISYFLNKNNCDVVVSLISADREIREKFKKKCGDAIVEIHVHTDKKRNKDKNKNSNYEEPTKNFFDMDTTSDNAAQSFNKLIHFLKEVNKI